MDYSGIFSGVATILTAIVAVFLVAWDRRQKKSDAAKIVLQEIRRAEDIMTDYIHHGEYKFTRKIIATNSWAQNIHYFVNDLDQDELDRISTLYSTGQYLDAVITDIATYKLQSIFEDFGSLKKKKVVLPNDSQDVQLPVVKAEAPDKNQPEKQQGKPDHKELKLVKIEAPWNQLFDDVIYKYDFIYHSDTCRKLKEIVNR